MGLPPGNPPPPAVNLRPRGLDFERWRVPDARVQAASGSPCFPSMATTNWTVGKRDAYLRVWRTFELGRTPQRRAETQT